MKLVHKIILYCTVLCAVGVIATGAVTSWQTAQLSEQALQQRAAQQLITIRENKKHEIERYFKQILAQLETVAANPATQDALAAFSLAYQNYPKERLSNDEFAALQDYYLSHFAQHYQDFTQITIDPHQTLAAINPIGQALQARYITANPYPINQKHRWNADPQASHYDQVHASFHPAMHLLLERFGYYDIFFIDNTGSIVYSVFKEVDFGSNLENGPFSDSALAKAYRAVANSPANTLHIEDFAAYFPSYEAPASFAATPVFKDNQRLGVLAFQMPIDAINNIMTFEQQWQQVGLGNSGETFIIGPDNLLRSQSRLLIEDQAAYIEAQTAQVTNTNKLFQITQSNSAIGLQTVSSSTANKALEGQTGVDIIQNYRNHSVLSAYSPVDIYNLQWAIIAEMDTLEAHADVTKLNRVILQTVLASVLTILLISSILAYRLGNKLAHPILFGSREKAQGNSFLSKISQMESQNQLLALVAENTTDAVIITNSKGRLVWANKALEQLSGHKLSDILDQKPGDLLQGQDTEPQIVKKIRQDLQQHQSCQVELLNYHKDGRSYWIDISISPVFDQYGQLTHFIAVERDITERKQQQRQLEHAMQKAEVSNQAKSTFLATMSHELRTPLNGILGMAQIIESNIENDEQQKQIQVLIESGEHLLSLLNNILDFSKIEKNMLELECIPFSFSDVTNPIVNTYTNICKEKGLELVVLNNINSNVVFEGDKPRIRQIIFNLISNAVKFTHQGSITLYFKNALTHNNQQGIAIKVEDTGIGIRQERLENIFDPFIQAESSTTRQYGGTGLGLTIVKQLVELMGGHLTLTSTEGKGTCFSIVIALKTQKEIDKIARKETKPKQEISCKLSILLAEDNKTNALVAKTFCQRLGHNVTVVENGLLALDQLKQHDFDLIIMDNHMPEMDGVEATKVIRQQLKLNTVIFAWTADVYQEVHDKFVAAGANHVLAKPLQKQGLIDAINLHLEIILKDRRTSKSTHKNQHKAVELHRDEIFSELALTESESTLTN